MSAPDIVEFTGVDGVTLVADEWNGRTARDTGRPTILMLHGGGQNRFSWKNTGQVLADEGFRVVAVDTRGHGDSDRAPDADYALESLTGDVLHVIDQIGTPVVLIGASMGGLTGIMVAEEAGPAKVLKLVLVDVVPRFEKTGSARIRDFMFSGVDGFDSLEHAAEAVAEYLPHRTRPRSPGGLKKNLRQRDGRWYWHWDPAFLTKPRDDPFERVDKMENAAMRLQIPLLLIRGKLSDVVSTEGVNDFLAKVPHAEFVELSSAGHTAAGDDNDAFSDVVVEFVNRSLPQSAEQLVTEFCAQWADPDPTRLADYFTEDGIYHNMPMPAVQGRAAIAEFIAGFTAMFDGIDFTVHRQSSNGDLVFNERTDVMRRKDGRKIELPVAGVFEIRDGRIAAWRDYFDMATVTAAFD